MGVVIAVHCYKVWSGIARWLVLHTGIARHCFLVGAGIAGWHCTALLLSGEVVLQAGWPVIRDEETFAEQQLGPVTDAQVCKDQDEDDNYDEDEVDSEMWF